MNIIDSLGGILSIVGAVIVALIGMFFKGKSSGKAQEKTERTDQINKQAQVAKAKVREVENETSSKNDDAVSDKLKSKWVRK